MYVYYVCMYVYIHVYICQNMSIYIVYKCICMHVCIPCVYTCVHASMCIYIHVCIHVCMYEIFKLGLSGMGGIILIGRGIVQGELSGVELSGGIVQRKCSFPVSRFSSLGRTSIHFVEPGVKFSGQYYRDVLLMEEENI